MSIVVLAGLGFAVGVISLLGGIRIRSRSLEAVLTGLNTHEHPRESPHTGGGLQPTWRIDARMGDVVANALRAKGYVGYELRTRLAIVEVSLEELCSRCLVWGASGALVAPLAWATLMACGVKTSLFLPSWVGLILGVGAAMSPILLLDREARRSRRDSKAVICTFLDLVVLSLAGGMGIESALLNAAQLGQSTTSYRMWAALSSCRETGEPPWEALSRLGRELSIDELQELAAAAALAGTEGARIRATLVARTASIRRHLLADAESEANAVTERLFLPGTLLLVGFLLFIGYPAFTRIASGF